MGGTSGQLVAGAHPGSLVQAIDFHALLPPLVVAVGAVAVLVADLLLPPARRRHAVWFAVAVLVAALVGVATLTGTDRWTFCVSGGGPARCSYQVDRYTLVFQALALSGALLVVLMSATALADTGSSGSLPRGEYLFLVLASVTGVLVLVAARDLVTLTVALETVSLPAFALVGLRRHDPRSGEAALKFFLISVAATSVTLFGVSLVYGVTGAVHLSAVAAGLPTAGPYRDIAQAGVAMTLVGFGFKVSAVPFHFWTPDVYTGAPVPIAAYLSVVSKAAGFAGLILVADVAFRPYGHRVSLLLGVLAAVTMTFGNLVALRQRHAVRLLAWSTIAQAGYVLVPLAGPTPRAAGAHAGPAVTYLVVYTAMNLGAFAVVNLAAGWGAVTIDDYHGLARRRPGLGGALAFFLLCLAGLPPGVSGLFAKIAIFRAATGGGIIWLAVVTAVNVVIGLAYYLRWIVVLYSPPRPVAVAVAPSRGRAGELVAGLAVALALAGAIALSVWPEPALHALGRGGLVATPSRSVTRHPPEVVHGNARGRPHV